MFQQGDFLTSGNDSPEAIAKKRALVLSMMPQYGRAANIGEGVGQLLNGIGTGMQNRRLNKREKTGQESASSAFAPIMAALGGNSPQNAPQSAPAPQTGGYSPSPAPSGNMSDMQAKIYSGLTDRGMPDHVARGTIANLMAESNLNPGINEANPLVAGSRGGFGLNQWTGPRRREYEAYAQERGAPLDDLNTQLDFTMHEMQGSESSAWNALQQTKDPVEAARVYSEKFLRPGIPHMNKRLGFAQQLAGADFGQPTQVASNDPSSGLEAIATYQGQPQGLLSQAPQMQQPQAQPMPQQQVAQAMDPLGSIANPVPSNTGPFPAAPQAAQQQPQGQQGPSTQQLYSFMSNPFATDAQKQVASTLLNQRMQQSDPNYQMDLQLKQQQLQTGAPDYVSPMDRFTMDNENRSFQRDTRNDDRSYGLDQRGADLADRKFEADQANSLDGYMRQVEFDKANGREPMSPLDYQTKLKQAGSSPTNVNVNNGEPNDANLRKELDKGTGELWSTYNEQAATSSAMSQDMQLLDELIKMAPQGPISGRMAEMFPGFSSAGSAFNSIVKRLAPTLRAPGSGSTSDIEYDGMLKSLPALGNKPEANAAISQIMKAKAQVNIERGSIVSAYSNGQISASEARSKMFELDKRSIMTPEMTRVLNGLKGETGGIPDGIDPADWKFMSDEDKALFQ